MNSNLTDPAPVFVACLGLDWGDKLTPLALADAAMRQLAGLCEARRDLVDRRTQRLNQLIACLKKFYPQALEACQKRRLPLVSRNDIAQPQTMQPMRIRLSHSFTAGLVVLALSKVAFSAFAGSPPPGFTSLFNGKDFTGWTVPEGDNGHWKLVRGVIDYDAQSEAKTDKNLWTEKEFADFTLRIDWRIKETTGLYPMPVVLPDGTHELGPDGKEIKIERPNADSGIYLRGTSKAQLNIWCWPIGSGEVYGYRMDKKMPPEVRAGVTPKVRADKPVGEWNTFEITMKGDRLTVVLNNITVIEKAQLPDVPAKGRIALQHHGGLNAKTGQLNSASSLMQFRNIYIKELN